MKVLALDSSGLVASVAVACDDYLLGEYTVNYKKTHSQTLLPMLQQVAEMIELDLHTVDAIAVAAGPGSFTGLRIGSATAKGIGLAIEKPIIPVPTVDALAYNFWGSSALICPLMDARRSQVYTGIYEFVPFESAESGSRPHDWANESGEAGASIRDYGRKIEFKKILPACAVGIDEIIARINELGKWTVFLGDGVAVFKDRIDELLTVPHTYAPPMSSLQRAASVASLGMLLYKEGFYEDAASHCPNYLRQSQADRECSGKQRDFQV
ncbi:MAG: tRNA (adenosine(37)-N6)-threonylcarbamoyltransferase complex dimerization subunit type 1 TsaB [Clostridiales bacterium]|nr:tRNA (adenosine(37)-N6)-threonylcarbamoyltransferase complex dimerization subunit type 1 TsaB [Clostridiales bacterium]